MNVSLAAHVCFPLQPKGTQLFLWKGHRGFVKQLFRKTQRSAPNQKTSKPTIPFTQKPNISISRERTGPTPTVPYFVLENSELK